LVVLAAPPLLAQDAADEEKEKDAKKIEGFRFVWKKRPSLRFGDMLRVDFRFRTQQDWNLTDPVVDAKAKVYSLKRLRAGVEGEALRGLLEYEVSYEFAETDFHWKDVYLNVRKWRGLQVRGGRFRIPFSLDQLTGPTNLDFVERSRIGDRLAPGRDTGVLAHGSLLGPRLLKYQFGYFANDGDNSADRNNVRTGQGAWAGRLTGRLLPAKKLFETLTLGGAFVHSDVPEGLYSLRLRTTHAQTAFPHYFVLGRRLRSGAELSWMPGPFSVKAEFVDVREGRQAQGLAGDDVPDLLERGWYVSGTWALAGQNKAKGFDRGKYIPFVGGFGVVELAVRAEQIRFASATSAGRPSRSIRASNVLPQSDRLWTFGVNWYMNQWVKFQANFVREWIEDSFRAAIPGQAVYWGYKFRLQGSL
jgi:phosphate-selective porin OprO/OprP